MPTLPLPDAKERVAQYLAVLGDPPAAPASSRSPATPRTAGTTGSCRPTAIRSCSRSTPAPIDAETLPFVNVGRLLEAMPVPTPRLLDYDNDLGILSLEDLGDVTLQAHLGTQPFPAHAALYRQAVAHIVDACRRAAPS